MFNHFYIIFCALAISTFAAPLAGVLRKNSRDFPIVNVFTTEEEASAELRAAGMTQASIDGLDALTKRFFSEYPLVKSDKETTNNYIAKYRTDAENYIKLMPANDQTICNNYLKKHELA